MMLRLFCGWDERESAGWHAFAHSVVEKTTIPVSIIPLRANNQRDGSNRFCYSRFLVPYLCDFQGFALWMDGADMIANADLAELWDLRGEWYAVQVAKHDYKTAHAMKYVGTEMETENPDYKRKNWSSVILWDCAHFGNRCLTPEFVAEHDGAFLHRFAWLPDDRIGELSLDWNWLTSEYGTNSNAKMLHFTAGTPNIRAYRSSPHAQLWQLYSAKTMQSPAERIAEIASAR